MSFDFDTIHSRLGTGSTKWSRYPADVLPMWIADMDIAAPPAVLQALPDALRNQARLCPRCAQVNQQLRDAERS